MRHWGGVSLGVLNLCARMKIRVATFDTDHSVTDNTKTFHLCFNPEASSYSSHLTEFALDSRYDMCIDYFEVRRRFFTPHVHES
jgi:hypothetical protein